MSLDGHDEGLRRRVFIIIIIPVEMWKTPGSHTRLWIIDVDAMWTTSVFRVDNMPVFPQVAEGLLFIHISMPPIHGLSTAWFRVFPAQSTAFTHICG
ncbi:hypothetical protein [uncultured Bifidobacterium sp.]|uniref:hypothetical protein n=1 Tax=uncultured Bifidobacterium sp. TaxID=165187 RepID=UPI002586C098|nr:hypothetical protein [uncultured Bifidobacterium sp.]